MCAWSHARLVACVAKDQLPISVDFDLVEVEFDARWLISLYELNVHHKLSEAVELVLA